MRRFLFALSLCLGAVVLAQVTVPSTTSGRTALVANVTTIVGKGLIGRQSIAVQNLSPNDVYCGWANVLTDGGVTQQGGGSVVDVDGGSVYFIIGFKISPGQTISWGQGYGVQSNSDLACMSAVSQTSPNDLRWTEDR